MSAAFDDAVTRLSLAWRWGVQQEIADARTALQGVFADELERAERAGRDSVAARVLDVESERDRWFAEAARAVAEVVRLRAAGRAVVDAWHSCREANSMQGFWTILDDLAAELDGRARQRRAGCICELGPASAVPSQSCPLHGHGPIPGRRG
jgi:hypothetical protein